MSRPWSKDMDALALQLYRQRVPFSLITHRLNAAFGTALSGNAVVGRLNRLGAERPPENAPPPALPAAATMPPSAIAEPVKVRPKKRILKPPMAPRQPLVAQPAPGIIPVKLAASVAKVSPVTLMERESWQCRWPVNDGGPFLFCGVRKADHDPTYCSQHRSMATARSGRRMRSEAP